jgi:3'(2'), 5'-bisphosphate nucleotidase
MDERLSRAVIQLCEEAGRAIVGIYNSASSASISTKGDGSPVTAADLTAHDILTQGLTRLAAGIPVVSEESFDSSSDVRPPQLWLVDPLDGTKEFINRNGEFTVNVALIEGDTPVWGVVNLPALGTTYWGGPLSGSFRRDKDETRTLERTSAPAKTVRVVASRSHSEPSLARILAGLGPHSLVPAGSSLKFCRVAEGAADLYPRLGPTMEWDTAAGHAVLAGAGGFVVDLRGLPLRYNKKGRLNPSFLASKDMEMCLRLSNVTSIGTQESA